MSDGGCRFHNTIHQKPQVCLNYDAYSCFYKPMFLASETPEFLRFDAVRFDALISLIEFDEAGQVHTFPDAHSLIITFICGSSIRTYRYSKAQDIVWTIGYTVDVQSQCEGCSAWCCQTISFPIWWYSLCFQSRLRLVLPRIIPGVELAMTTEGMSVFVHSRCRNPKFRAWGMLCFWNQQASIGVSAVRRDELRV